MFKITVIECENKYMVIIRGAVYHADNLEQAQAVIADLVNCQFKD